MPSLLIVEDENVARRALSQLLNSCGFRTDAVPSAEEALEVIEAHGAPNIALLDIDLPGMSGLELAAHLEQIRPDVMMVLVSATDGERIRSFCRAHTQVTYIRKPLDFTRLLRVLNKGDAN